MMTSNDRNNPVSNKSPSIPLQDTFAFRKFEGEEEYGVADLVFEKERSGKKKKAVSTAAYGTVSPPRCQVESCLVDLSNEMRYYRRHKVCQLHAKALVIIVAGNQQRFCQQCSRFHEVREFDNAKRSCRRRLAGHNERRRKCPPSENYKQASSRSQLKGYSTKIG